MRSMRQEVCELMAVIHLIPPDLAEYRVVQMDEIELHRRFCMYTGMELSVAGRNQQSGPDFYPVFGFATAKARLAALNPVSVLLPTEQPSREESARAGDKKPGPSVDRAMSASH